MSTTYTLKHIMLQSGGSNGRLNSPINMGVTKIEALSVIPAATIILQRNDEEFMEIAMGDNTSEAIYNCINKITNIKPVKVLPLSLKENLATISIEVKGETFTGENSNSDLILAIASAYLDAINKALEKGVEKEKVSC